MTTIVTIAQFIFIGIIGFMIISVAYFIGATYFGVRSCMSKKKWIAHKLPDLAKKLGDEDEALNILKNYQLNQ